VCFQPFVQVLIFALFCTFERNLLVPGRCWSLVSLEKASGRVALQVSPLLTNALLFVAY